MQFSDSQRIYTIWKACDIIEKLIQLCTPIQNTRLSIKLGIFTFRARHSLNSINPSHFFSNHSFCEHWIGFSYENNVLCENLIQTRRCKFNSILKIVKNRIYKPDRGPQQGATFTTVEQLEHRDQQVLKLTSSKCKLCWLFGLCFLFFDMHTGC